MGCIVDMNDTSTTHHKSRNARFIPFFLILVVAVAIGFAIRHFLSRPHTSIEQLWDIYFSDVQSGENSGSLEKTLVTKLRLALVSIDAALYHLESTPISEALVKAHNRGVKVRVFTENRNSEEETITQLQNAGILVRDDGDEDGYMHHKFFVIDNRYVWTGSYNTTYNGAYKNDNNVIWIDSVPLANNFTKEFQDLYLSGQYNLSSGSQVPYPQITLGDGTQITTLFSPKSETIPSILNEINSAKKSVHFMAFSFTHDKVGDAMIETHKSGIDVSGVFDENQISRHSEYHKMKESGMPVKIDETAGTMHHKVIIIDEETVITGSYNFSRNAEINNSENLLIIKNNRGIGKIYMQEFIRLYN